MAKSSQRPAAAGGKTRGEGRRAQNSLVRIVVRGAAVGLLTLVAGFVFLLVYELPQRNAATVQAQSNEQVRAEAAIIRNQLAQMRQRLAAAVQDPTLVGAFADAAGLSAREKALRLAFPEALSLRLVPLGPLGTAALNDSAVGLRNNIEADLLRQVSGGKQTAPEAYPWQGSRLISFAEPVMDGTNNYATGALLVTLPAAWLEQPLGEQLDGRGSLAVTTLVGSTAVPVITVGSGGDEAHAATVDLKQPGWTVHFQPASGWVSGFEESPLPLILVLALSAVGSLLGMLLVVRDVRSALVRNLQGLDSSADLDLPGFEALRQRLREQPVPIAPVMPTPVEAPAARPEPQPAAPEAEAETETETETEAAPVAVPEGIFRAYDIRGLADAELSDAVVYQIGLAIGSEAVDRGQQEVIVGRDGRESSERICDALVRGLRESGRDVVDIGLVPTPLLYFATHQLGSESGVVVTGSHNPAEYNGLKIVLAGRTLSGRAIQGLKERIQTRRLSEGRGGYRTAVIDDAYVDYIVNDVAIAQPLKIVIDAGNGVAGAVAPRLFTELGCEVIPLYCDVDGRFPHHHPDPTVEANLSDLIRTVRSEGADLGIAFDGDGDRVGVVTASGRVVPADRLLMVLAQDVVSRNPGADILFDVKCSRVLNTVISSFGGRPIMWKTGHSFMKEKMAETGALLGGEFSGHIFFNERWFGFDDGLYAAARLIEILSTTDPDLDNHLAALPPTVGTPEIKLKADDTAKFDIVARLAAEGRFGEGKITTLDGVRVDYPDGWGLVRASNTTPALILRFEADNEAALNRIQTVFREQLVTIDPGLAFGF